MNHLASGSWAWRYILTMKCFKKCCISTAVNGTDDMLWNGSEEDGNVRSVCVCVCKMKALTVKVKDTGKGK